MFKTGSGFLTRPGARLAMGRKGTMDTGSSWVVIAGSILLTPAFMLGGVSASHAASVNLILDHSIETFRVADFDPSDASFHPRVFTVIVNGTETVKLHLEVSSDTYGVLAVGTTPPFPLSLPGSHFISNQDLTEAGGALAFETYQVQPEADELENLIHDLGYLPEGRYCFLVQLLDPDTDVPIAPDARDCLTVTNPRNLELIRPGAPFGDALPRVLTANPQFQWNSRARAWRIEITEEDPGDASGEDVLEHVPVYQTTLGEGGEMVLGGGSTGTVSWSYPSVGEELRRGRTYCWRVTAIVETSGGPEEISSEIYCFRRWDPSDLGAEQVADALSEVLPSLIDELGPELQGMIPTGIVMVDGVAIDAAELRRILDGIASGKLDVLGTRLE